MGIDIYASIYKPCPLNQADMNITKRNQTLIDYCWGCVVILNLYDQH